MELNRLAQMTALRTLIPVKTPVCRGCMSTFVQTSEYLVYLRELVKRVSSVDIRLYAGWSCMRARDIGQSLC